MTVYDVIVVGAGPAGSSCSIMLARSGMNVLLCDRSVFPRHKICGDCINPAVWPLLDQLSVAKELREKKIAKVSQVRVTNAAGLSLVAPVPPGNEGPFFAMKRHELDSLLLVRARKEGVHVREGISVREIQWNGRWSVTIGDHAVEARFLVGADGRNSVVARQYGQSLKQPTQKVRRVGVQWLCPYQRSLDSAVELFLFKDGYCGVVNVDDHHANVCMVTNPAQAQCSAKDFSGFLSETLLGNPSARKKLGPLTPEAPVLTAFPIEPFERGSVHPHAFLVGDARKTLEPFTGEGIFSAILDGMNRARWLLGERSGTMSRRPERAAANELSSFILKRPTLAGYCVNLGTVLPPAITLAMKSIFR